MNTKWVGALAFAVVLTGCLSVHAERTVQHSKEPRARVLRHVVLFKFKPASTPADVRAVETAFAALPAKIDEIHDLEWGTNVSPENLAQGFTHCFFVTFKAEADRDVYLHHLAHDAFVKVAGPHLDQALVVDYWTNP